MIMMTNVAQSSITDNLFVIKFDTEKDIGQKILRAFLYDTNSAQPEEIEITSDVTESLGNEHSKQHVAVDFTKAPKPGAYFLVVRAFDDITVEEEFTSTADDVSGTLVNGIPVQDLEKVLFGDKIIIDGIERIVQSIDLLNQVITVDTAYNFPMSNVDVLFVRDVVFESSEIVAKNTWFVSGADAHTYRLTIE